MDTAALFWGLIFGSIGLGYFVYGKKQKVMMPFVSGLGLMVVPYVISNMYILILSGIVLIGLPLVVKL